MKNFEAHGHACIVCGKQGEGLVTWHHLLTKRVRSDLREDPRNLIPVCQQDHNLFHSKGTDYMAEKHQKVKSWLVNRGWEFDSFREKWVLPSEEK